MATAKRKQEELGEECDDQEQHDNDACSDDDDAKRPRLDLHHQHMHQMPHHRQWSCPSGASDDQNVSARADTDVKSVNDVRYDNFGYEYVVPKAFCKETNDETPCDLSNWHSKFERGDVTSEVNSEQDLNNDDDQPINFAYYHF